MWDEWFGRPHGAWLSAGTGRAGWRDWLARPADQARPMAAADPCRPDPEPRVPARGPQPWSARGGRGLAGPRLARTMTRASRGLAGVSLYCPARRLRHRWDPAHSAATASGGGSSASRIGLVPWTRPATISGSGGP